ncbi:hypothetical protein TcWFU_004605 [Taenia crassiceps]|uniref:Uncharacterized protein n=1 Tax=Taenia crassiceps TaxID=6207 RepID=A0ABR4QKR0_9CEST
MLAGREAQGTLRGLRCVMPGVWNVLSGVLAHRWFKLVPSKDFLTLFLQGADYQIPNFDGIHLVDEAESLRFVGSFDVEDVAWETEVAGEEWMGEAP